MNIDTRCYFYVNYWCIFLRIQGMCFCFLQVRLELSRKAEKRTTLVLWGGLAYMATQFGILARLTWWEYSWDIMEPVTYFITYGSAMAMYAYFVMTRQVGLLVLMLTLH